LACLPAGVTCEKGPGWCEPGYYCGYRLNHDSTYTGNTVESIQEIKSPDGDQRCRPLGGCGQVGGECCPSNADAPHTNTTDKLARKPFCRDGNICVWNSSDAATTPTYAGVRGETRQTSHACCLEGLLLVAVSTFFLRFGTQLVRSCAARIDLFQGDHATFASWFFKVSARSQQGLQTLAAYAPPADGICLLLL
jgi:hypothetical protein